jgi:hypothetical protein
VTTETPITPQAAPVETDISTLTQSEFETLIGQDFLIPISEGESLTLRLESVTASPYNKGRPKAEGGEAYSLRLTGPTERYFKQATAPLQFPDGRVCPLLIVNNGPHNDRMSYQIIFG